LVLGILSSLPFKESADMVTYRRAADISINSGHHLIDTLYHAVALQEGATLVTADEAYFTRTKELGGIALLAEFAI
jgi:predicted nucleic acid-binding protein